MKKNKMEFPECPVCEYWIPPLDRPAKDVYCRRNFSMFDAMKHNEIAQYLENAKHHGLQCIGFELYAKWIEELEDYGVFEGSEGMMYIPPREVSK